MLAGLQTLKQALLSWADGLRARCQHKTLLAQLIILFHILPCVDPSYRLLFITTDILCLLLYALS
jgi:hypothetical protein